MRNIFRLKILRQKQIGVTAAVLLTAGLLLGVSYGRLKEDWLNDSWKAADALKTGIDAALEQEETLLDIRLNGLYGTEALFRDAKNLFLVHSREAYLEKRLADSRQTAQPIRSFPGYMKTYIREYDSALYKIGIEGPGCRNLLYFDLGTIRMGFDVPEESREFQMDIRKEIAISKPIYDISSNYREMGKLYFFYDIRKLLPQKEPPEQLRTVLLLDSQGGCFSLKGSSLPLEESSLPLEGSSLPLEERREEEEALQKIAEGQGDSRGAVRKGLFGSSYYYVLDSAAYDYRLAVLTDDSLLLGVYGRELLPRLFVIGPLAAVFLFFFFLSIRYDYKFINHIYASIASVNQEKFEDEGVAGLSSYRSNEYGQIARELDEMCVRLKRHILREYQLKIKQQETQMRALQHQINPHFLYNSLEVIRSIALVNQDREAADAMTALGSLYRDIVKGSEICTFREEIRLLEKYLKLMQYKCMGNFFYQIQIEEGMWELETVKFWMQPLSENFFVHGFEAGRPCNVMVIEGKVQKEGYLFEMVDNGSGIPEEEVERINCRLAADTDQENESIGLANVYRRLRYFYGAGLTVRVANNPEGGARIRVFIPKGEKKGDV